MGFNTFGKLSVYQLYLQDARETAGDMFIVLDLYCPDKKLPSEVCLIRPDLFTLFSIKTRANFDLWSGKVKGY